LQKPIRKKHIYSLNNRYLLGKEVSDALAQYNETYKITIREKQVDALKKAVNYSEELLTYGMANYLKY
jgi:hypothetical protein